MDFKLTLFMLKSLWGYEMSRTGTPEPMNWRREMTEQELVKQWLQPGAIVPIDIDTVRILLNALREALAEQAQQEQGDSVCQEDGGCPTELAVLQRFWRGQSIPDEHYPAWFKPAQQEPVAWHHPECEGECIACLIERCVKDSYGKQGVDYMIRHMNAAPKREWVGLTDEEIAKAWSQSKGDIFMRLKPFARAIEAAHGIKGAHELP